ncbi:nicotinate-nucleotide adenylyltransferase [Thalassococcus sp. CAU 1522]|uniref:Probable nicotinate-nucleotide adenylyltransferase n=1 Tax=Thalassococcus arenae TaxID=2851652 RepID=A0ABS6N589_9RHOB|nr:nicotinate-nucleotide adenylyltransferase [Thalassococcus arenae]MBV2358779.1 nicotinate-nucleotide adenylyltransferase [Thalassococcus arenae]
MTRIEAGGSLRPGQTIGLLGGSFDPPHAGHVHISRHALIRFGLDRVIWLVSPGNPLKPRPPAPLARRLEAARALLAGHPRMAASDFEARSGTLYTAETLEALHRAHPGVRFVWLMGADNLAQFHRWERWRDILATTPIGVLARPGQRIAARASVASRVFRAARLSGRASRLLPLAAPPAWCYVNVPMRDISSTALRDAGQWPRADAPDAPAAKT